MLSGSLLSSRMAAVHVFRRGGGQRHGHRPAAQPGAGLGGDRSGLLVGEGDQGEQRPSTVYVHIPYFIQPRLKKI